MSFRINFLNRYNKKFFLPFFILFVSLILVSLPLVSLAQTTCDPTAIPCTPGCVCNPIKVSSINTLIKKILEGVIKVGIPIIALAIVYCGFLFVSAKGKPEELKKAKDALLYTLIGAAILLGSWAIAQLISETVIGITS